MSNPYLQGNFAPVSEEVTTAELKVTGTIPAHLDGRYLRIGPNPLGEIDPDAYHWFLGDGMVHGIRLRDGRAEWYRNRYVRTGDVARALGETPRPGRAYAGMDFSVNTNVIGHAGRTFAIAEGGAPHYELTDELDTIGRCDFSGTLPGAYTGHPLCDPATGELHAVSYFFGWGDKIRYTVIGTDARVRRTVDIPVGGSPMMHAFSLTEKYVVVYDLPVTFDTRLAVATAVPRWLRGPARLALASVVGRLAIPEPILAFATRGAGSNRDYPYSWDDNRPARIGLLPREGQAGDIRWYPIEPCYVYHPVNAYDEADTVVLDVVSYPKVFHTGPDSGLSSLQRWTIDTATGKVRQRRLDDRSREFPRIDERRTGRRHRYGYAVATTGPAAFTATLLKHDYDRDTTLTRDFGPHAQLSEFTFVPDPDATGEDEGIVMGFVYDATRDRSDLTLLDARTLTTIAVVHLPARVPNGLHGNWIPA